MKSSFAFYQGMQPGLRGLSARLMAGAGGRRQSEMLGMQDAARADLFEAQADEANEKAAAARNRNAALADDVGFVASQAGIDQPLARRFLDASRAGNFGTLAPLTPNDDDGNANPSVPITEMPEDMRAAAPRVQLAQRLLSAARAGGGNADQLAKAAGEFQGQGITDRVQADIDAAGLTNPVDRASARNQGGKLGQKIDRFSAVAGGGTVNDATGEIVQGAKNAPAVAALRAAIEAAGGDPDGAQARELYKQLAVKLVTHPGIMPERAPPGFRATPGGGLEAIPGGPADVRAGALAEARAERDAARAEREAERRTQNLDREVTRFKDALDKSNVPTFAAILDDIEKTVAGLKDLPGFGQTGFLPAWMLSDEGKDLRRKIASLRNIELKDRSGAAVTDQELRRFLEEMGTGLFQTDRDLLDALKNVRTRFNPVVQNHAAGVSDEVLQLYRDRGGMAIERGPGAKPAAPRAPAAAPAAPRAPAGPAPAGGRPPLSSFDAGGAGGTRTARQTTRMGPGQVPVSDRVQILRDELDAERRRVAATPDEQARQRADIDGLLRELRALGVKAGGV